MKKVVITISLILIAIVVITGCSNKKIENMYHTQQEVVEKEVADIKNISEEQIKKSVTYIRENYTKISDKEVVNDIIYHVSYLEYLTKNVKENELIDLVTYTKNYISSKKEADKKKLSSFLDKIESKEDNLIKDLYTKYNTTITITKRIEEQTPLVEADLNDANRVNEKNINKAINYIALYYQTPYENDEILSNMVYYSLFLSGLSKEGNEIVSLGKTTMDYLKSLEEEEKTLVRESLSKIGKNQEEKVKALYKQISNT